MNFGNLTALRDLQLTVQGEPEEGQGRTYCGFLSKWKFLHFHQALDLTKHLIAHASESRLGF